MTIKDLKEKVSTRVEVQKQYKASGEEHKETIEKIMGIKIPQWYIDFLNEYGYTLCWIKTEKGSERAIANFDLLEMYGFIKDQLLERVDEVQNIIPIGNDVGDLMFFYSERHEPKGIYASWTYFDLDDFTYIAPNIQSLLTDEESLNRYSNFQ